jgi:PEP-CTERM/exosortase A-associated glycosyltransferase
VGTDTFGETVEQVQVRPVRVLHVLDHSWPVHSGYSFRSLHLLAAQQRLGLCPQVLTGPLQLTDDQQAADSRKDGLAYWRTPYTGSFSQWAIERRTPILREATVVRLLRRRVLDLLDREPFDIIHAHSPALCGLAALWAARSRRLPFVYELRAFWEDAAVDQSKTHSRSLRYVLSRKLEDYVVHRADAVVGIAKSILNDLLARKADPSRLFHVPNGVDTDKFFPTPPDHELAAALGLGKEKVLGFIGSFYSWEGVAWLVRAVVELRRRGDACKLLLIGDGEEMPAVRAAVQELGASDFVLVLGRVPHEQVERYYSVVDVLVYPRHRMRLTDLVTPLKPLEAMAQAKAVLGSDVGGIQELIEPEKTGLLFRAGDVDDFCRQARRLIQDESLRRDLGTRARDFILQEKDWKTLARRYVGVYEAAIRNLR